VARLEASKDLIGGRHGRATQLAKARLAAEEQKEERLAVKRAAMAPFKEAAKVANKKNAGGMEQQVLMVDVDAFRALFTNMVCIPPSAEAALQAAVGGSNPTSTDGGSIAYNEKEQEEKEEEQEKKEKEKKQQKKKEADRKTAGMQPLVKLSEMTAAVEELYCRLGLANSNQQHGEQEDQDAGTQTHKLNPSQPVSPTTE